MSRALHTLRAVAVPAVLALALAACAGTADPGAGASPEPTSTASATASEAPAERITLRIASLTGPTSMGLVSMMQDAETGTGLQDYEMTMYGTADEVVPQLVKGDVDAAVIPANLAAVVHQQSRTDTGPQVQVAAVTVLGVLSVVEAGDTVHEMADLAGRTIYSTGKGTTPEFVLRHLLTENGIDPDTGVRIEYLSEATEVAAVLASTPGAVAVLPQPFVSVVTTQQPTVRVALDLTQEWAAVDPDSQLVTAVLVVRADVAAEHPQAVADLMADVEASIAATNDDPEAAAELIVAAGIVPAAPVAVKAIPASHLTFLAGAELEAALGGYLQVLFDANPASVGGAMPGDDFYYAP